MSTGGIFTLITNQGKQDKILTATEALNKRLSFIKSKGKVPTLADIEQTHILFTNAHFKPFVAMASEYSKVQASQFKLGEQVTLNIPEFGDLFGDMYLHVKLHVDALYNTTSTVNRPLLRWCEYPGERMMKNVRFEMNGNLLDEYTSESMCFHRNYFLNHSSKRGYLRCVGQDYSTDDNPYEFTSNIDTGHTLKLRTMDGNQSFKTQLEDLELLIPLQFWFNKNPAQAIPSIAIPDGRKQIKITTPKLDELVIRKQRFIGANSDVPTLQYEMKNFDLYTNNYFVNPEIHDIYIKRIGFQLIRVHQNQVKKITEPKGRFKLYDLKWPTEYMMVAFRPLANETAKKWNMFGIENSITYTDSVSIPTNTGRFQVPTATWANSFPKIQWTSANDFYLTNTPTYATMSLPKIQVENDTGGTVNHKIINMDLVEGNVTDYSNKNFYVNKSLLFPLAEDGPQYFGRAMVVDGDYLYVGSPAPENVSEGFNTPEQCPNGKVYIYKRCKTGYKLINTLLQPGAGTTNVIGDIYWRFGISLAVNNNHLFIGAETVLGDTNSSSHESRRCGCFYVYNKQSILGEEKQVNPVDLLNAYGSVIYNDDYDEEPIPLDFIHPVSRFAHRTLNGTGQRYTVCNRLGRICDAAADTAIFGRYGGTSGVSDKTYYKSWSGSTLFSSLTYNNANVTSDRLTQSTMTRALKRLSQGELVVGVATNGLYHAEVVLKRATVTNPVNDIVPVLNVYCNQEMTGHDTQTRIRKLVYTWDFLDSGATGNNGWADVLKKNLGIEGDFNSFTAFGQDQYSKWPISMSDKVLVCAMPFMPLRENSYVILNLENLACNSNFEKDSFLVNSGPNFINKYNPVNNDDKTKIVAVSAWNDTIAMTVATNLDNGTNGKYELYLIKETDREPVDGNLTKNINGLPTLTRQAKLTYDLVFEDIVIDGSKNSSDVDRWNNSDWFGTSFDFKNYSLTNNDYTICVSTSDDLKGCYPKELLKSEETGTDGYLKSSNWDTKKVNLGDFVYEQTQSVMVYNLKRKLTVETLTANTNGNSYTEPNHPYITYMDTLTSVYELTKVDEVADSLSLTINNIDIYNKTPSKFFNSYVPYKYSGGGLTSTDNNGIYFMKLCLYPGLYQPSGHINFSRVREAYFGYEAPVVDNANPCNIYIEASALNFLLISDGSAVLRYSI